MVIIAASHVADRGSSPRFGTIFASADSNLLPDDLLLIILSSSSIEKLCNSYRIYRNTMPTLYLVFRDLDSPDYIKVPHDQLVFDSFVIITW